MAIESKTALEITLDRSTDKLADEHTIDDCVLDNDPRMLCLALQSIFMEDDIPYSFSTYGRNNIGTFKLISANITKLFVKDNGNVVLFWESRPLENQMLRKQLKRKTITNDFDLCGEYKISVSDDRCYTVKMTKIIKCSNSSIDFAGEVACEQISFLADVNKLAKTINELWYEIMKSE